MCVRQLRDLDFSHVSCSTFQLELLIAGCQDVMLPSVRRFGCALLTQLSRKLALPSACALMQETLIWLDHNWELQGYARHLSTKGSKVQCVSRH